jgi:hypothetical protein
MAALKQNMLPYHHGIYLFLPSLATRAVEEDAEPLAAGLASFPAEVVVVVCSQCLTLFITFQTFHSCCFL